VSSVICQHYCSVSTRKMLLDHGKGHACNDPERMHLRLHRF